MAIRNSIKHHPSLYLPDGDLVVSSPIAGGKDGYLYFRIDSGMVGDISKVEPSGQYDGVPLIKITDDAEIVTLLFEVLYDESAVSWASFPVKHPSTPILWRDVLKMADKYDVESFNLETVKNIVLPGCPPPTYYKDGDIVLRAQYTSKHKPVQYFRVHRFLLSLHSPIFADMLRLPIPGNMETYDGVPLIRLSDRGEDVAELLNFLYNPSSIPFKRYDPNTPLYVRGALKLAKKYEITDLQTRIIEHLEADWPRTLVGWDMLQAEMDAYVSGMADNLDPEDYVYLLDDKYPEPASAINLARECDLPSILLAAFYHLAQIPVDHDWDNARKGIIPHYGYLRRTARWNLLDSADIMRVLKCRDVLSEEMRKVKRHALDSCQCKAVDHTSPQNCSEWRRDAWSMVETRCNPHDPLAALALFESQKNSDPSDICVPGWYPDVSFQRNWVWNGLSKQFGLLD